MPMQPNTYINEAFSSTSTRFNPQFDRYKTYKQQHLPKWGLSLVDVLENASFVHAFVCIGIFELTVTSWWIIATQFSIPNWFELHIQLPSSYSFTYFLLRSLLPFTNSKFLLMPCLFTFIEYYDQQLQSSQACVWIMVILYGQTLFCA